MNESLNVYDREVSEHYVDNFSENPSRVYVTGVLKSFLASEQRGGKLVDLGCGTGDDWALVEDAGYEYIGIDLSKEMLSIGRQNGVENTLASDLAALPFKDNTFDAATSLWSLQYKEDLGATLAEWKRVLIEGAPLLLVVPHPLYKFAKYSRDYFVKGIQWDEGLGIRRFNFYHTVSDYANALITAGFVISSVEETQRIGTDKVYDGIPKENIPHDLIIKGRLSK